MGGITRTLMALSISALIAVPQLAFAELERAVVKVQGALNCSF